MMRREIPGVAFRKWMFTAALGMAFAASAANTWYVDANNGNDDWNGKADYAHANPAQNIGPKKTLSVFTALVSKGDTIYAAPGRYNEKTSPAATSYRFYTAAGNISLISTGTAADTIIEGTNDTTVAQTTDPFGCGPNAVVPVKMLGNGNVIRGFTIANGRTINKTNACGGGAEFNDNGGDCMIDCVVTNCIAYRGGGVQKLSYALRCHFTDNHAGEGAHGQYLYNAVNCLFENTDGYAVYNGNSAGTAVNCTFRNNTVGAIRTNGQQTRYYNSVLLIANGATYQKAKLGDFYNCLFDYDPIKQNGSEGIVGTNGECRVVATGSVKLNADGTPTAGCTDVIDRCVADYYDNNFPTVFGDAEKPYDLLKNARTYGTAIDLGACERQADTPDDWQWFVDAENGDDANTGKTPEKAKKTLAAIAEGRKSGDVIYAASGVYSNGTVTVGGQLYRVSIPKGVQLVGTAGAEETIILGQASETPDWNRGTGPGAVSCVYVNETDSASGVVSISGFTLSGGCSNAKNGSRGSAIRGVSYLAGIMVDCIVTNCVTARGPVHYLGNIVRCRFYENASYEGAGGSAYEVNAIYDSYFSNSRRSDGTILFDIYNNEALKAGGGFVVNCTFDSDGAGGPHAAASASETTGIHAYNCLLRCSSDGGGAYYHNGVNGAPLATGAQASAKDDATIITNYANLAITEATYRPVAGNNPAVGYGDYVYYTNKAPVAIKNLIGKDLWGNARRVGEKLDVGAVACDRTAARVTDEATGLVVESASMTKDGKWHDAEAGTFTVSRDFAGKKDGKILVRGFTVNGTYYDFNDYADDWEYEGVLTSDSGVSITAYYPAVNDWYVDANNGNDVNDGLTASAAHAFKTLARASTNALMEAGATVYVAEGVYNEGIVPAIAEVDETPARMLVSYKINFKATGNRANTIIEGASSTATESGMGAGAVRCCLSRGGTISGFTLRKGNVNAHSTRADCDQGGGIKMTSADAYAFDCEIHHCNAVRGGGVQGIGWLVRCHVHDNTTDTTGVSGRSTAGQGICGCSGAYNCVSEDTVYTGGPYVNCTLTGSAYGMNSKFINCYIGKDGATGSSVASTYTNCVCATAYSTFSTHDGCVENVPCKFDANWRPRRHGSAVVNTGDNALYDANFPDLSVEPLKSLLHKDSDYAGGARVLEEKIDIGAGEMVWSPKGLMFIFR